MKTTKKLMGRVDGQFDAQIVGAEPGWYLVQEIGTKRLDWYQAERVWIY